MFIDNSKGTSVKIKISHPSQSFIQNLLEDKIEVKKPPKNKKKKKLINAIANEY